MYLHINFVTLVKQRAKLIHEFHINKNSGNCEYDCIESVQDAPVAR